MKYLETEPRDDEELSPREKKSFVFHENDDSPYENALSLRGKS